MPRPSTLRTPAGVLTELKLIADNVKTSPNPFDLSAGFLTSLSSTSNDLADAVATQRAAEAAYRDATIAKNAALRTAIQTLSQGSKTAIVSGASDNQLASIGFSRPAKPTRTTTLKAPTNLVATGLTDSQMRVAFDRNGNGQGTAFEIYASATGGSYAFVGSTTRASVVLDGYAPGAACWFRVRATRAGLVSPFSNDASMYAPAAPQEVELKIA